MKKKRWLILIVVIIILLLAGVFSFFFYQNLQVEKRKQDDLQKKKMFIAKREEIKSHYASFVRVTKDCDIFKKSGNKYSKMGKVYQGEVLELEEVKDFSSEYFPVKDYGFSISSSCVLPSEKRVINTRYKNYVPFPKTIKTKDRVTLYRDDKKVYSLFSSISSPVIKQDDDSYYVEYFGELFRILKNDILDVEEIQDNSVFAKNIPVTAYHFIYKEDDYGCSGIICHPISQIRSHFEYLRENHYFTITTREMEDFLDEKIHLPEKSILVTIDDGDRAENIIPLLEEYQINATLFLITAWYFKENYQSPYLELASHTHELHEGGRCAGGQGSPLKCLDKSSIVADLKQSRDFLDQTVAFCYPLYEYNDHAVDAVREAGFHLGFIGGQKKASIHSPKLLIPRITIHRTTTLQEYQKYVS